MIEARPAYEVLEAIASRMSGMRSKRERVGEGGTRIGIPAEEAFRASGVDERQQYLTVETTTARC